MKCSLGISNFLEEISSLSHSVIFLYFFCTDHWGRLSYLSLLFLETLHSNGYIFPFLLCLSILFFSQLFVRPPQTAILPFLHFFFLGIALISVSCTMSWTSIHSSSGTLSDLVPQIYFLILLYNHKGFDKVIPEWSSGFPYFLQFKSEFCHKEFINWAIVSSQSYFCWLYRASPSLAAKNIINHISVLAIWWCPCVESSPVLFAMTSALSWQNSITVCPASFCIQSHICLLLQVFLDFLLLHSSPL